jgi:hypothetical protein
MRRYLTVLLSVVAAAMALVPGQRLMATGPTTVVVSPSNMNSWYFWNDKNDIPTGSPGELVSGPATPPSGTGSVRLGPLTDSGATAAGHSVIATDAYFGTALADLTALSYSTHQPGPVQAVPCNSTSVPRPMLYGGRLVFEPYQVASQIGSAGSRGVPLGTWWATKTTAAGRAARR